MSGTKRPANDQAGADTRAHAEGVERLLGWLDTGGGLIDLLFEAVKRALIVGGLSIAGRFLDSPYLQILANVLLAILSFWIFIKLTPHAYRWLGVAVQTDPRAFRRRVDLAIVVALVLGMLVGGAVWAAMESLNRPDAHSALGPAWRSAPVAG